MSNYTLRRIQRLPISLDKAWVYFSSPHNLGEITPSDMGFEIRSDSDTKRMYEGQIITYTIKPFLGIPLYWLTEITHVKEYEYFIDEQRFGPYAFWHHAHFFREIEGGIEMRDLLHYKVPMGKLGVVLLGSFIKNKVESIFDFRYQALDKQFGSIRDF